MECFILKILCHEIYGAARKNIYWLIKVKTLLQPRELWEMGEKIGTENVLVALSSVPEIPEEGTISGHLSQGQNLV